MKKHTSMKARLILASIAACALAAANSTFGQGVNAANGNLGDWNIWSPNPPPNGSYGGSASVTSTGTGGPGGGGYSIIPNLYPGQDGGAYTFFGTGSSTTHALNSSDFSQSIAIYLEPTVEVGNMLIDETPASKVLQNDGSGNYSYSLWSAENGFRMSGDGSKVTISAENGGAIGTITTAGWYDFTLIFSTTGELLSVSDLTDNSILGSVASSVVPGPDLAGSGYLWFTEWDGTFTDPGTLNVADLGANSIPDPGSTALLLGLGFLMLAVFGFRQNRLQVAK